MKFDFRLSQIAGMCRSHARASGEQPPAQLRASGMIIASRPEFVPAADPASMWHYRLATHGDIKAKSPESGALRPP